MMIWPVGLYVWVNMSTTMSNTHWVYGYKVHRSTWPAGAPASSGPCAPWSPCTALECSMAPPALASCGPGALYGPSSPGLLWPWSALWPPQPPWPPSMGLAILHGCHSSTLCNTLQDIWTIILYSLDYLNETQSFWTLFKVSSLKEGGRWQGLDVNHNF